MVGNASPIAAVVYLSAAKPLSIVRMNNPTGNAVKHLDRSSGFHMLTLFVVALSLATGVQRSYAQGVDEIIDAADRDFVSIRASKKSIPQSTLQNWVRLQERFRDLFEIANATDADPVKVWESWYVTAFGFGVIELHDVAAAIGTELAKYSGSEKHTARALHDVANALESSGQFEEAVTQSLRRLELIDEPSIPDLNNHALRLLKAGEYAECIKYVQRIDINEEDVAHTRLFSARAYAYQGKYSEAMTELRAACSHGDDNACGIIESLASENAADFWRADLTQRRDVWQPYNRFDSAYALPTLAPAELSAGRNFPSAYLPSFWFNEIHNCYEYIVGHGFVATYPNSLPKGVAGALVVDGVPFFAAILHGEPTQTSVSTGVKRYVYSVHGPSAWGASMPISTRALVAPIASTQGKSSLMIIVHNDWQEAWVMKALSKLAWKVVK